MEGITTGIIGPALYTLCEGMLIVVAGSLEGLGEIRLFGGSIPLPDDPEGWLLWERS